MQKGLSSHEDTLTQQAKEKEKQSPRKSQSQATGQPRHSAVHSAVETVTPALGSAATADPVLNSSNSQTPFSTHPTARPCSRLIQQPDPVLDSSNSQTLFSTHPTARPFLDSSTIGATPQSPRTDGCLPTCTLVVLRALRIEVHRYASNTAQPSQPRLKLIYLQSYTR